MKRKTYLLAQERLSPSMLFEDAAAELLKALDFNPQQHENKLARHVGFVEPGTLDDYRCSFKALGRFFNGRRLNKITPADLRTYQEKRVNGELTVIRPANMQGAGPNSNTVNKELGTLLRLIKAAKAWSAEMFESYIPLSPHDSDLQRAMLPKEQEHFLMIAASKPEWATVYWYSVLALSTTMSTNEMRNLRLRDIDTSQGIIRVSSDGAKNKYRIRPIPIDQTGIRAVEYLIARARRLGARAPEHFIFPFRVVRNRFDPTRTGSDNFMRKQWEDCRAAADLKWLRLYDLRHTAITRLAEAGTPIQVIMDMAGHVSQKMQQHYTHISMQAKRLAVDLTSVNQAANVRKRKPGTQAPAVANDQSFSVNNLITALKGAGLPPDQILNIVMATQNGGGNAPAQI